jgi:hypothetical protein
MPADFPAGFDPSSRQKRLLAPFLRKKAKFFGGPEKYPPELFTFFGAVVKS